MSFNMFNVVVLFVLVSLCLCDATEIQNVGIWPVKTSADCPGRGYSTHGYWTVNDKEGTRCVLVCFNGYEPDNCHVLRKIGPDRWNMEIPQCVKKSWIPSWKTVAKATVAVAAGAGAVVAAPVVLSAAGFTSAGVAAGSIAAGIQGSATAAGGVFAACQSAGAAGLATGTQAGLFSVFSAVTGTVTSFFGGVTCEQE